MTTFEILTIVFYAVVVMIGYLIYRGIDTVIDNQQKMDSNLRKMDAWLYDRLANIQQQLANIEDNILNELRHIRLADKMVDIYKHPTSVNGTPCYAPDGICTNPQRDCISCPKIGTGGTWSTSTNISKNDE